MTYTPSTPLNRLIVIHRTEDLKEMRTAEHGALPLTNPGKFKAGVYRGSVNPDGTATITRIGDLL